MARQTTTSSARSRNHCRRGAARRGLVGKDRPWGSILSNHVTGVVTYPQNSPAGGNHAATPLTCGTYDQPVPNENAVQSLEHDALWITYRPGLAPGQLATLKGLVKGDDHRLLSPYPNLPAPIVASAWSKHRYLTSADDPRLAKCAKAYAQGPTDQESGAPCQGVGTSSG